MGVDILVKDIVVPFMTSIYTQTFDESLGLVKYRVTDFRKRGMKWYFFDTKELYHNDYLMGNGKSHIVESKNLIIGAKKIIADISLELNLKLPNNPIKARDFLQNFLDNDKSKIESIIDTLKSFCENNDIVAAWDFLSDVNKYGLDGSPEHPLVRKIVSVMDYAELAVFFYFCGEFGHQIEWSF